MKVPYASLTAEERDFLMQAHLDMEGEDAKGGIDENLGQELTFNGKKYHLLIDSFGVMKVISLKRYK